MNCVVNFGRVVVLGALGLASASLFAQETHVAIFKSVSGSVKIERQAVMLDATAGSTLQVSDRIVSGPGATGGIVFRDGTLLTIGPSTDVRVRDYVFEPAEAHYQFSVYLAKGSAIYSSGKIGKIDPAAVKVSTPTATVGVRGTRFIIQSE